MPFLIPSRRLPRARSKALEQRLLTHPTFGVHIRLWRGARAISRRGKRAALAAFAVSIAAALLFAPFPWSLAPIAAAAIGGSWIWTRPEG